MPCKLISRHNVLSEKIEGLK